MRLPLSLPLRRQLPELGAAGAITIGFGCGRCPASATEASAAGGCGLVHAAPAPRCRLVDRSGGSTHDHSDHASAAPARPQQHLRQQGGALLARHARAGCRCAAARAAVAGAGEVQHVSCARLVAVQLHGRCRCGSEPARVCPACAASVGIGAAGVAVVRLGLEAPAAAGVFRGCGAASGNRSSRCSEG
jgi:hypothetical protein